MAVDLDALTGAIEAPDSRQFGRFGVRCKTCRLLLDLPADDPRSEQVRGYVLGATDAATVAATLSRAGVDLGTDSVLRHRRGKCKTGGRVDARG